jgi:hypothetical protein
MCCSPIAVFSASEAVALPPTEKELEAYDRDAYVGRLTKNAGFVGRSKQARAVNRHCASELELRIRQNAGTDRYASTTYSIAVADDKETFTVTYKVRGKRSPIAETYAFLPTWDDVQQAVDAALRDQELPVADALDLCTHYPEYWWLAKHYGKEIAFPTRKRTARK